MNLFKKSIVTSFIMLSCQAVYAGCPVGYMIASPTDVRANITAACSELGEWDIARIRGNGSLEGPGYGCNIRDADPRPLVTVLCKKPLSFLGAEGECPDTFTIVDPYSTIHFSQIACTALAPWAIARLDGNGSMDGSGYRCGIRVTDDRQLRTTLCANYTFKKGDNAL